MGRIAMITRGWGWDVGGGGLVVGAGMEGTEEGMTRCMNDMSLFELVFI